MKPFWKTSEFWLTILANGIGCWQQVKPANPYAQAAGAIVQGMATGGYAMARGITKSAAKT